jgi:hypothetical protein
LRRNATDADGMPTHHAVVGSGCYARLRSAHSTGPATHPGTAAATRAGTKHGSNAAEIHCATLGEPGPWHVQQVRCGSEGCQDLSRCRTAVISQRDGNQGALCRVIVCALTYRILGVSRVPRAQSIFAQVVIMDGRVIRPDRTGCAYDLEMPAVVAAGLAGVLLVASLAGELPLAVAVIVAQALLLVTLSRFVQVPAARAATMWAMLAGAVAVVLVAYDPDETALGLVAPVLGLGFLGGIVLQLARRHGRNELTLSLTFAVTALVLAALLVPWVALRTTPNGAAAVVIGLAGVGVANLAETVPGTRAMWRLVGVIAAAGVGAALGSMQRIEAVAPPVNVMVLAALAALLAAAASAVVDRVEAEAAETSPPRGSAGASILSLRVALPVAFAAPAAYVLGRLLLG